MDFRHEHSEYTLEMQSAGHGAFNVTARHYSPSADITFSGTAVAWTKPYFRPAKESFDTAISDAKLRCDHSQQTWVEANTAKPEPERRFCPYCGHANNISCSLHHYGCPKASA